MTAYIHQTSNRRNERSTALLQSHHQPQIGTQLKKRTLENTKTALVIIPRGTLQALISHEVNLLTGCSLWLPAVTVQCTVPRVCLTDWKQPNVGHKNTVRPHSATVASRFLSSTPSDEHTTAWPHRHHRISLPTPKSTVITTAATLCHALAPAGHPNRLAGLLQQN